MGKKAITLGCTSTGHDGYFPVTPASASGNVFVSGRACVRAGDSYNPHWKPKRPSHTGIATSSSTVLINGRSAQREGDSNSCGDTASSGHANVRFG